MKIVKIAFGTLFAIWAVCILPPVLSDLGKPVSWAQKCSQLAGGCAAIGTMALFSYWCFESALRKQVLPEDSTEQQVQSDGRTEL
jgi:hypothetical protein